MDKKTIIGFVLIAAILIGFNWFNKPSQEQLAAKKTQDSIATLQVQQQVILQADSIKKTSEPQNNAESNQPDSVLKDQLQSAYGVFASAANGKEEFVTIENELIELKLSTKGGRIYSARLKKYTAMDSSSVILFNKDESSFGLTLITENSRVINTEDLYFETVNNSSEETTLRLRGEGNVSLDFNYYLQPGNYMLRFEIVPNGLDKVLASNMNTLDFKWMQKIPQQENGRKFEAQKTQLFYKYSVDDVESLSESADVSEDITNKLKWIAYKDQYFSTVLIADGHFQSTKLNSKHFEEGLYLKEFNTSFSVPFDPQETKSVGFHYYFGPNQYSLLKGYDKKQFKGEDMQLEKLVPLGWSLFRYVNEWVIIPLFGFFTGICGNIGIAIFLLTLAIKTGLFPLTYKSFMSSAKMRVMRPQVEEINAKYPGQENAMTRQQKSMELYRQVGVNPMSGCLPMLLQMPFLFALFMFFPSAIELRHQSFLWANDLSTYDAIVSWNTYIPLVTPYFGNHVSLFCLLMTITSIFYTKFNMDQTNTGQQQMPGMKMMMYTMPLFMLVFLNQSPAGLNYYYFLSTLITIIQTIAFRYFLNEEKLLVKLEENKKKPVKKKSGFMARLEDAQRQQQALAKQRAQQKPAPGKRK